MPPWVLTSTKTKATLKRLDDRKPFLLGVSITNEASVPVQFLGWNTPFDPLTGGRAFQVRFNGRYLLYDGPFVKRVFTKQACQWMRPGEMRTTALDLSDFFAVGPPGEYEIKMRMPINPCLVRTEHRNEQHLQSNAILLTVLVPSVRGTGATLFPPSLTSVFVVDKRGAVFSKKQLAGDARAKCWRLRELFRFPVSCDQDGDD